MKKVFIFFLSLCLFLLIICDDDANPFSPEKKDLIGNWIATQQYGKIIQSGVVVQEGTMNFTNANSPYVYSFSDDQITLYMHFDNEIDSGSLPYFSSGGKLFVQGMESTIQGNTLILNGEVNDTNYIVYSTLYLKKYSGTIPPREWLDIHKIPTNSIKIQTNGIPLNKSLSISQTDWYVFDGEINNSYEIRVASNDNNYIDFVIKLYETTENGEIQIISNDYGWGTASLNWECEITKKYYFSISGDNNDEEGEYKVSVSSSLINETF